MVFECDTNVVRKTSLLHLTMLTSIVAAASLTAAHDPQRRPAIPFCDHSEERTIGRRLLYITTLDGRLSALDTTQGGRIHWSIPTEPGPLISSSIHRLELTNNGQFVRMIPSLSGGIYKFNGESIDPIPITTDNLLSSSAKFSDDLVISGGKETRTYGVSARTGQLLYKCSMHGCENSTDVAEAAEAMPAGEQASASSTARNQLQLLEHDPLLDDVIVVRRQTQTVRAVESRTGIERWNFSVGQHELDLIKSAECHDRELSDMDMAVLDLEFKVIVPEGIICAFSKSDPNEMLWKHKFDHPIVSGWKIGNSEQLEAIDMFSVAQWLWNQDQDNIFEPPFPSISPSIYLGMYQKQLYIQESIHLRKEINDQSNLYAHLTTTDVNMPKIPWRPIAASSNSLVIFQDDKIIGSGTIPPAQSQDIQGNELMPYDEDNFALSAQSVLNASEFVNGNGFYLYTKDDFNRNNIEEICDTEKNDVLSSFEDSAVDNSTNNKTLNDDLGFSLDDIDAPVKVVILSLWFWWKEIVVIAFTSAVLLNLLIGHRIRPEREIVVIERHIPVPTAIEATEASTVALLGPVTNSSKSNSNSLSNGHRTLSESTNNSGDHFSSRFQGDFDLSRCLGRGGFGVVFEAKNKLDDCKYAVKRITLPNKKESRERVMREVKTLANCEHQNIVRYFQAWVETPPPGWQEEEDSKWLAHEMSTSIQIETPDGTTLPSITNELSSAQQQHHKGYLLNEKKKQLLSWVSSVTSTACSADFNEDKCIDEAGEEDDDEDSCVVFRSESQSLAMRDDSEITSDETNSNKTKYKNNSLTQRTPLTNAISIDIHSNSFELDLQSIGNNNINHSRLSDSFQIEFVRAANDELNDQDYDADEDSSKIKKSSGNRPLSLELSKGQHNIYNFHNNGVKGIKNVDNANNNGINCKALMPALATQMTQPKAVQNKVYLYIQMQLCRKESLRDWLRDNKTEAREQHIGSIFHQIVDAVDYVHLKGLIHRDLKPSNIFFSQDGQIKIGDFGLVTDMSDIPNLITKCGDHSGLPSCARHTQQVGTHLYMSPEQLRGQHYDYKVDIYSLGLIFFELLVYFSTEMERIVTLRDLRDGHYPDTFSQEHSAEYDLLQCMLSNKPEERPSTIMLKQQLSNILQLPETLGDIETSAQMAAVSNRLSRSRTFSSSAE